MLYRDEFKTYNKYLEVDTKLQEALKLTAEKRQIDIEIDVVNLEIRKLFAKDWMTIEDLEASTGLTSRAVKGKIRDASLVGIMVGKQWWLLKESMEDAGYAN